MVLESKKIIVAIVMLGEAFVFASAVMVIFVMSAWMESDAFMISASEIDWWVEAGKRFIFASFLSLLFVAAFWLINKLLLSWIQFKKQKAHNYLAVIALFVLLGSSLMGAITFAITRPFM